MSYAPATAFGRSVYDDALTNGMTPDLAAQLAQAIEHPPKDEEIESMSPRVRAMLGVRMSTDRDELADLAASVGATALLPALRAAALPLAAACALLRGALDPRTLVVHGQRADNLRAQLHAMTYWTMNQ